MTDKLEIQGNPMVHSLPHHQCKLQPKDVGGLFVQAPFLSQRKLLADFALQRAVLTTDDQPPILIEDRLPTPMQVDNTQSTDDHAY